MLKTSTLHISCLCLLLLMVTQLKAQDKLLIDDQLNIVDEKTDALLKEKFQSKGLTLTSTVDFRKKCEYYFATILKREKEAFIEVKNCTDEILGYKELGSSIAELSPEEKTVIIYYAIQESIENPAEKGEITSSFPEEGKYYDEEPEAIATEHDSRYFFAPSAMALKKGELYYNTVYFLLHDLQYGVSDRFTLGIGTTIIGFPVYATAKYTIPFNEKSHLAFGDLAMAGTYGSGFVGNLLFSTYTYGTGKKNISFGAGLLSWNDSEISNQSNTLLGNFSAIAGLGTYFFVLTENYVFQTENTYTAFQSNPNFFREAQYEQTNTIWYGVTGLRFVRKSNALSSWQLGLTHLLRVPGPIPSPYDGAQWDTDTDEQSRLIAFPTISYTRKFKLE